MARSASLSLGLLVVLNGLLLAAPSWSQSAPPPRTCSSAAVAEGKLQTSAGRVAPNSEARGSAHRKVVIERIEFDRPVQLTDSEVQQVIDAANQNGWNADASTWTADLSERLLDAWQNQGYFKAVLAMPVQARSLGGDPNEERFLVGVHVENEGPQFHFGDLRFTGGNAIPQTELREAFPLRGREVFAVSQVRAGLQALTKLYASRGYIDFTASPTTYVDDNLQRVSLSLQLDEGKQYRVGVLEIRGLDPTLEARLRSIVVPGDVFNPEPVVAFIKKNRPAFGSDNLEIRRNETTGTVDLTPDLRACP